NELDNPRILPDTGVKVGFNAEPGADVARPRLLSNHGGPFGHAGAGASTASKMPARLLVAGASWRTVPPNRMQYSKALPIVRRRSRLPCAGSLREKPG